MKKGYVEILEFIPTLLTSKVQISHEWIYFDM